MAVYVLSRIIFALAGVRFDARYIEHAWQAIDPVMLMAQPFKSLWYLHAQPPAFNALIGIVLHLAPGHCNGILHAVFLVAGCAMSLAICALIRASGASSCFSVLLTSLFVVGPASILYENFLWYEHLTVAVLVISAYLLYKFVETNRYSWGIGFFTVCALAVMTRSLLHLIWLVGIVGFVVAARPGMAKKTLISAALPFLLCLGWYVKNEVIFGEFTSSTWMGFNATACTVNLLDPGEREKLVAEGLLSPLANALPPFQPISRYPAEYVDAAKAFAETMPRIALLQEPTQSNGSPNYHYAGYILLSKLYWADSVRLVRLKPWFCFKQCLKAAGLFLLPSARSPFLADNRAKIGLYEDAYTAFFLGGIPQEMTDNLTGRSLKLICWTYVVGLLLAAGWWIRQGIRNGVGVLWPRSPRAVMLVYVAVTILYIFTVSTLMEHNENQRYSYLVSPLVLIFLSATCMYARAARSQLQARVQPPQN